MRGSLPPEDGMDPEVSKLLGRELDRVDVLRERFNQLLLSEPLPGSPASVERAQELGACAFDQAATNIQCALDHLLAWKLLFAGGTITAYAHLSIIRTAHECAYVALWLMDKEAGPEGRRARGVAAQYDDYKQRRLLEADIGYVPQAGDTGKSASQRIDDLSRTAQTLGLTRTNGAGRQVLTLKHPDVTELFARYEPTGAGTKGSWLYRFYSGYAHGKQWATSLGASALGELGPDGRGIAMVGASDNNAAAATHRAVNAAGRAIGAYAYLRM